MQIFSDGDIGGEDLLLTPLFEEIGGWLDGKGESFLVYTIPISVGFPAIQRVLENCSWEWFYGNIYDPTDGVTPLNWWDRFLAAER